MENRKGKEGIYLFIIVKHGVLMELSQGLFYMELGLGSKRSGKSTPILIQTLISQSRHIYHGKSQIHIKDSLLII